jgi:hypothetical protein
MSEQTTAGPAKECKGLTFFPVPQFSALDAAFGASENKFFNRYYRPKVPKKYEDIVSSLFFNGGAIPDFQPAVDRKAAVTALRAWLGSWAPPHESKVSTVAYAMWLWTEGDLS